MHFPKASWLLSVLLLIGCILFDLWAAETAPKTFTEPVIPFAPKHYICYRTPKPLEIDGRASEPVWEKVDWTDEFVDIDGPGKPQPRFKTRIKMLWDAEFFYIFARIEEPHIWGTLKKHDSVIFYDNDFEVFIDPDGDTFRYYELEINALGTAWDLFLDRPYRDQNCALFFWDIRGLKKAVSIDGTLNQPNDIDQGWNLEIAIPWNVLQECAPESRPPAAGEYWRVNFSRVEWQVEIVDGKYQKVINPQTGKPFPEDNWVWSPQGIINMHYPEMWGFVQFSAHEAGAGGEMFRPQSAEAAKWLLRQIYYRERTYFLNHNKYCADFSQLGLQSEPPAGYQWPPEVAASSHQFSATLTEIHGKSSWIITQDGQVRQLVTP